MIFFNHCRSIEILMEVGIWGVRKGFMEEVAFMLGLIGRVEC